jgi:hypothetical protein
VLALSTPVPLRVDGSTATATISLRAGQTAAFALHHARRWEPPPPLWDQGEIAQRLDSTIGAWRSWSRLHQAYEGPWKDLVHHSGRVLQALTFQPTGAIVAAPTTSLPETIGGQRNWDYRFTWVRDASLTMEALWVAACPDEANRFFDFLAGAAPTQLRRGQDLQIMFGVGGEHDLTERELPHLGGWRDSRPVRVGKAPGPSGWSQTIDAIAERLTDQRGLVYRYRSHDGLEGEEGTFLLCTFWLAQAQALAGDVDRARATFQTRSASSTTSACWPRRSTQPPASCSATSRTRSATSAWSTLPGRSPTRNATARQTRWPLTRALPAAWQRPVMVTRSARLTDSALNTSAKARMASNTSISPTKA